tara:strand:+ start:60 stop:164 length:105 start_codon:yes stop_codon:yes gene_type:complete
MYNRVQKEKKETAKEMRLYTTTTTRAAAAAAASL